MARADLATPARRLPLAAKWMARGSMVKGVGWLHSHIPASQALRRRAVPSVRLVGCGASMPPTRQSTRFRHADLATGRSAAPSASASLLVCSLPPESCWCSGTQIPHSVWGAATTGVDRGGALYSAPERAAERGRARPSAVHRGSPRLTAAHRDIAQVTLLI